MNEREKLVKELNEKYSHSDINNLIDFRGIVDFILADRKRIVEPLVKLNKDINPSHGFATQLGWPKKAKYAIDETIKNAGL